MSKEPGQPAGPTSNPLKSALIVALAAMVIMTVILYLPYSRFTAILAAGFTVFVFAYLYFLSREFGLWCQRMAGAALGAVATLNIVPGISIYAKWGEASLWAKIEGRDRLVDLGLLALAAVFGYFAYLYRRSKPHQPVKNNQAIAIVLIIIALCISFSWILSHNSSQKQNGSTSIVSDDQSGVIITGSDVGNVSVNQSGVALDDDVANAMFKQLLRTISEKDEDIKFLKEKAIQRTQKEAGLGKLVAQEAIDELRNSGNSEKLLYFLEKEADQYKIDFIDRCLEISAVAYLRGNIDTARKRIQDVFKLDPNELRALKQLGHIERLQGNLDTAESTYRRILVLVKFQSNNPSNSSSVQT